MQSRQEALANGASSHPAQEAARALAEQRILPNMPGSSTLVAVKQHGATLRERRAPGSSIRQYLEKRHEQKEAQEARAEAKARLAQPKSRALPKAVQTNVVDSITALMTESAGVGN